jgi:3-hydroxypropanoate dehydrogenase
MNSSIVQESIQQVFTDARTHHAWLDREISDEVLAEIFDVSKWGPTSVNSAQSSGVGAPTRTLGTRLCRGLVWLFWLSK